MKEFIELNLLFFPGRIECAESTVMPSAKTWIRTSLDDLNCYTPDDHTVFLWLNCPVVGIMPSEKYEFFLTCITNFLQDWSRNGVCIIVHPNRAAQLDKRTLRQLLKELEDIILPLFDFNVEIQNAT